jgi:signal transduction histidine kinase
LKAIEVIAPGNTALMISQPTSPDERNASGTALQEPSDQISASPDAPAAKPRLAGLSAKLLMFTVVFVMLAEVFIFVPSIAFFRLNWLIDRLNIAKVAALVAEAAPDGDLPPMLRDELLSSAQVRMVALKRANQRRLILSETIETPVAMTFDLTGDGRTTSIRRSPAHWVQLIKEALMVFVSDEKSHMRVLGEPGMAAGETIEIIMPLKPLRQSMIQHAWNVFGLSLLISLITAGAVYFTLNRLLVAPMMRLTNAMMRFSANPEDAQRIIQPSDRIDEIGTAERELARMQTELHQALAQKNRLAALGLAVSKINHDLRNLLANAQLLSDRLTSLPDPQVQRFAPKLIASLDRAIRFCNETLQFGRAAEPPPRRTMVPFAVLANDVGEGLGLAPGGTIRWEVVVDPGLLVDADPDQLYRVISNLTRNAVEVLGATPSDTTPLIRLAAHRVSTGVVIDISDNGPGLPPKTQAHLFEPFQGSTRRGGTGLGLVIAREIISAHGGTLDYIHSAQTSGAHFRITLPDRPS